jgi:hypothetical protein
VFTLCFVALLSATIKNSAFFQITDFPMTRYPDLQDPSRFALRIIAAGSRYAHDRKKRLLRSGLANLILQLLAHIADAFLLVRVWWSQTAHVGRNLANFLAIDA